MTELLHRELTGKIIGVYYAVYNGLSRTYPEFIYENAMMRELRRQGIRCTRQDEYEILYKGQPIGAQRLDIFVAEEVVVEIKVKPRLTRLDQAQTMSYLKTTGRVGELTALDGQSGYSAGHPGQFPRRAFGAEVHERVRTRISRIDGSAIGRSVIRVSE